MTVFQRVRSYRTHSQTYFEIITQILGVYNITHVTVMKWHSDYIVYHCCCLFSIGCHNKVNSKNAKETNASFLKYCFLSVGFLTFIKVLLFCVSSYVLLSLNPDIWPTSLFTIHIIPDNENKNLETFVFSTFMFSTEYLHTVGP